MATTTTLTGIGLDLAAPMCPAARQETMQTNARNFIDCDGKWKQWFVISGQTLPRDEAQMTSGGRLRLRRNAPRLKVSLRL
jgi:hypothetical protein